MSSQEVHTLLGMQPHRIQKNEGETWLYSFVPGRLWGIQLDNSGHVTEIFCTRGSLSQEKEIPSDENKSNLK
jgi:hypothetical protein